MGVTGKLQKVIPFRQGLAAGKKERRARVVKEGDNTPKWVRGKPGPAVAKSPKVGRT